MKAKTKKTLYLTKEEQKIISQFCDILNNDDDLTRSDAWGIVEAIRNNDGDLAGDCGYEIKITD